MKNRIDYRGFYSLREGNDSDSELYISASTTHISGALEVESAITCSSVSVSGTLHVETLSSSYLFVTNNAYVTGTLQAGTLSGSSLFVDNGASITGSLNVSGSLIFDVLEVHSGPNYLTGSTYLSGTLTQEGGTVILNNLIVNQGAEITGSLSISGSLVFDSLEVHSGPNYITGSTYLSGAFTQEGGVVSTENLTVNAGPSYLSGSTYLSGAFTQEAGTTTIENLAVNTGPTYFSGSTYLSGAFTQEGGAVTAQSLVVSTGPNYFSGSTYLSGTVSQEGGTITFTNLIVNTGPTYFSGTIYASGTLILEGSSVTLSSSLEVSSSITGSNILIHNNISGSSLTVSTGSFGTIWASNGAFVSGNLLVQNEVSSSTVTSSTGSFGTIWASNGAFVSGNLLVSQNISGSSLSASIDTTKNCLWVNKNGSDTTGDGTIGKPFLTISRSLDVVISPTIDSPWSVNVGAGTFEETELTIPEYTGLYGLGTGTTKIKPNAPSTTLLSLSTRSRVERLTLTGITTGSNIIAINSNIPSVDYIDAPRISDLVIRDFTTGVLVQSASSIVCFDIRYWDNQVGLISIEGAEVDLYNCYAYQLSDPRAAGSIGIKGIGVSQDTNYIYFTNFNSWNNETSIVAEGTNILNGGIVYGSLCSMESEGVSLQADNFAKIQVINFWSKNVVNLDVEQKDVNATIYLHDAHLNFDKISILTGGENNVVVGPAVDTNTPDKVRIRGPEPSFQIRNTLYNVVSGGLWRMAADSGHFCIERNTHVSGAFATYSEDLEIDEFGRIGIGDIAPQDHRVEISGNLAIRGSNRHGLYFYSGSNYVQLQPSASLSGSVTYTFPPALPTGSFYLVSDVSGNLAWAAGTGAGEVNSGSNIGTGEGLIFAGKTGVDLDFKTLKQGTNITITNNANDITIDASAAGEVNPGSNLGTGFGIYSGKTGVALDFKTLIAGGGIAFTSSSTEITIEASGSAEVISGANLGSGLGVFSQKNISTLEFKSLTATTSSLGASLQVSASATEINITSRPVARTMAMKEDWFSNSNLGLYNWQVLTSGAGASIQASSVGVDSTTEGCFGVIELDTGTSSAGRAASSTYINCIRLDSLESSFLEFRLRPSDLSTVAQEYRISFGWGQNNISGDQANGVYFEYDRLTAGDVWRICSAADSVRSKASSGVAVQATVFDTFKIETNNGLTEARFYINGVNVGTRTLNLPVGAGRMVGIFLKIEKTAGTTTRSLYCDYVEALANWVSPGRS